MSDCSVMVGARELAGVWGYSGRLFIKLKYNYVCSCVDERIWRYRLDQEQRSVLA